VETALEHMRLHHPAAPVEEEKVREIVSTRSYAIEYVAVYTGATDRRSSSLSRPIEGSRR